MKKYIGKCLVIEEKGEMILVIGDLHLGYEESLNDAGVFVERKMFKEMVEYLDRVFESLGRIDVVVLLGDVKHRFGSILRQEWGDVLGLVEYLEGRCDEIIIVKGNHDNILEPIVRKREKVKLKDFFVFGEYCFVHGDKEFDEMYDNGVGVWVMGHGHPAVKISDGVKVEKYKCFLEGRFEGRRVVIVPSFFEYVEGSDPRENDLKLGWDFDFGEFNVMIVGEELRVLDFGILCKLK